MNSRVLRCRSFAVCSTLFGSVQGRMLSTALLSSAIIIAPLAAHAQTQSIGRLNVVRQVLATRDAVVSGTPPQYAPARQGQLVFPGQGVRTLRRSQAEIQFTDKSVLRINERTDLIVQDAASLRRIQLNSGLIWLRVAKGVATQVETPSATAVARGTEFTVGAQTDGSMLLTVYEGTVAAQVNGQEVLVHPGEQVIIRKDGVVPQSANHLRRSNLPTQYGGTSPENGWWNDVADNRGLSVIGGTTFGSDLRTSISGEALQQLSAAGLAGNRDNNSLFFLSDAALRDQLRGIAQSSLVTDYKTTGLSLDAYRRQYGSQTASGRFSLSATDSAFLAAHNVKTVDDFVQSALVNGASVTIPLSTRAYYQPGSITGTPNYDLRVLDRTESSDSLIGIGAGLALLSNFVLGNKWGVSVPIFEVSGFGLVADPTSFYGARGRVTGLIGKTRYRFESNAIELTGSDLSRTRHTKLASIAEVEQPLTEGVTLFAGRRRFYHGPVFQNQNLSQLIADRYSSAGLTIKSGAASFEGAYLHDANPAVQGAQKGALGSLFYRAAGGQFGIHYIHVPELTGKEGYTGSFSLPVWLGNIDAYGELGRGPDKATLQTAGLYFPNFFQKTQTDMFVEYGSHQGVGRSLCFIANHDVGQFVNFRGFVNFAKYDHQGRDVTAGISTLVRFGN